jgi:sulfhydrogenase subunit delta
MTRPTLAVFKFASCDGCQLSLLDCEDELLLLAEGVQIAHFLEASREVLEGPYDLGLVEGSITTEHDAKRIVEIRSQCRTLITIGACATAGGIQALRNTRGVGELLSVVYARPEYISTLDTSTPIAAHVKVDFELRGCPVNKAELLDVLLAFAHGRRPNVKPHAVCVECKLQGHVCVMVTQQQACLGPVTHSGCGALCPGFNRGCYGCFGPSDVNNPTSLERMLYAQGKAAPELLRLFRSFNPESPAFKAAAERAQARLPEEP